MTVSGARAAGRGFGWGGGTRGPWRPREGLSGKGWVEPATVGVGYRCRLMVRAGVRPGPPGCPGWGALCRGRGRGGGGSRGRGRKAVRAQVLQELGLPAGQEGVADRRQVDVGTPLREGGRREPGGQGELGAAGLEPREGAVGGGGVRRP